MIELVNFKNVFEHFLANYTKTYFCWGGYATVQLRVYLIIKCNELSQQKNNKHAMSIFGKVHFWESPFLGKSIFGRVHFWESPFLCLKLNCNFRNTVEKLGSSQYHQRCGQWTRNVLNIINDQSHCTK